VSAEEVDRARILLVRRARGEPAAHLTGRREFYGRPFEVTRDVLIPRPETELMVDRARELLGARPEEARGVADVGTGSGCIAVTLALEVRGARVTALDVSPAALAVARRNAEALGATVRFLEGDGPEALPEGPFDLIASNPPYVDPSERTSLEPQVRDHEPALALFLPEGDPDHWLRRLLESAWPRLAAGGALLVELGAAQSERALALCAARGREARIHRDLAGLPRLLEVPRR
jgi:release factor glutamine methyltransferase